MILVIGLGGNQFPDGALPLFGMKLPAIATEAVVGILLNLIFVLGGKKDGQSKRPMGEQTAD